MQKLKMRLELASSPNWILADKLENSQNPRYGKPDKKAKILVKNLKIRGKIYLLRIN